MNEEILKMEIENAMRKALAKNLAAGNSLPDRINKLIDAAAGASKRGESQDFYFMQMSAQDLRDMDTWLVQTQHPLAYKPGTQRDRFFALVKERN